MDCQSLNVKKQVIRNFYEEVKEMVKDKDIVLNPMKVFMIADTEIKYENDYKVIAPKGSKNIYTVKKKDQNFVTMNYCVNAAGKAFPSQIIFRNDVSQKKRIIDECSKIGMFSCFTKDGHQTSVSFEAYLKHLAEKIQQSIVFFEKNLYNANLSSEFTDILNRKGFSIKMFPDHTKHIFLAGNVSIFNKIQKIYDDETEKFKLTNNNCAITAIRFLNITRSVNARIPNAIIQKGFQKSGLFPFQIEAVIERFIDDGK